MGSRKFVRCGPYKLYKSTPEQMNDRVMLNPWDDEKSAVISDCWSGPGWDGDRIMLVRFLANGSGLYYWSGFLDPVGETGIHFELSWSGAATVRSPKVAAEKLWQFIEGVAGIYVDAEGWANE